MTYSLKDAPDVRATLVELSRLFDPREQESIPARMMGKTTATEGDMLVVGQAVEKVFQVIEHFAVQLQRIADAAERTAAAYDYADHHGLHGGE